MLWWLQISIKDIIDILLLAVCLYYTYVTLRYSGSRSLFMGIVTFIILWLLISQVLQMRLMGALLDKFVNTCHDWLSTAMEEDKRPLP